MRARPLWSALGGASAAIAAADADQQCRLARPSSTERLFAKGEVVVRYRALQPMHAERADAPGQRRRGVNDGPVDHRARAGGARDGLSVGEAVTELAADPIVDFAEPNYIYHQDSVPNDPFFGQLWGLNNTGQTVSSPERDPPTNTAGTADADIDAPEGWDVAPVENGDARDVVVAIVDSGIDYEHPDLAPNMWHNPGEIPGNSLDDDAERLHRRRVRLRLQDNVLATPGPNPCTNRLPSLRRLGSDRRQPGQPRHARRGHRGRARRRQLRRDRRGAAGAAHGGQGLRSARPRPTFQSAMPSTTPATTAPRS